MHPRHRIDASLGDLLFALLACVVARSRDTREAGVVGLASVPGETLACLSVRSAFDLLLEALALPPGSEVAVSAVTHPDMVRIIERHGLVACPVDLDLGTLAPTPEALESVLTVRTRVLVVAHLFGGSVDLAPLARLTRERGILLVEDCAQSFRGADDAGDAAADVSLWSFGPLKTATALGGALARVRDEGLRERMRSLDAARPVTSRAAYARRAAIFLVLAVLARPGLYGLLARRRGFDVAVTRLVRGFPPGGDELFERIRMRPSAPLLAVLARRLRRFDAARLARRTTAGEDVRAGLPDGLFFPGAAAARRTHWVFPVVSDDREAVVAAARSAGFDATCSTSAIAVVPPPRDRPWLEPGNARRLRAGLVFLPVYPEIPASDRRRLVAALHRVRTAGIGDLHLAVGAR